MDNRRLDSSAVHLCLVPAVYACTATVHARFSKKVKYLGKLWLIKQMVSRVFNYELVYLQS